MQKYLQLTDAVGQEHLINLNYVAIVNSVSSTECRIKNFNTEVGTPVVITHAADTVSDEFQAYIVEQMQTALASSWSKPVLVCEPRVALAINTIT